MKIADFLLIAHFCASPIFIAHTLHLNKALISICLPKNVDLQNRLCGYYKYMVKEDTERQFCYLLKSCAKRMIDNINCPLGKNNFLDMKFFVPNLEGCAELCRDTRGCRYYWWYPIENRQVHLLVQYFTAR